MTRRLPKPIPPALLEPNFAFGAAALLRVVADWCRRQAPEPVDLWAWEERTEFAIAPMAMLRCRHRGAREIPGLEVGIELIHDTEYLAAVRVLEPEAVSRLSAVEAEALVRQLYAELEVKDVTKYLKWREPRPVYVTAPPLPGGLPEGTRVRVRRKSRSCGWLPNNWRKGWIVGELDRTQIQLSRGWDKIPPAHIYLVHLPEQGDRNLKRRLWEAKEVAYADYELELDEEVKVDQ